MDGGNFGNIKINIGGWVRVVIGLMFININY